MGRHLISDCLLRWGWQRTDLPAEEVGECTDVTGCTRPGRWTHRNVLGEYCAQHAHQGGSDGFGSHSTTPRLFR